MFSTLPPPPSAIRRCGDSRGTTERCAPFQLTTAPSTRLSRPSPQQSQSPSPLATSRRDCPTSWDAASPRWRALVGSSLRWLAARRSSLSRRLSCASLFLLALLLFGLDELQITIRCTARLRHRLCLFDGALVLLRLRHACLNDLLCLLFLSLL